MSTNSKRTLLFAALAVGILGMGVAGWWVGSFGTAKQQAALANADIAPQAQLETPTATPMVAQNPTPTPVDAAIDNGAILWLGPPANANPQGHPFQAPTLEFKTMTVQTNDNARTGLVKSGTSTLTIGGQPVTTAQPTVVFGGNVRQGDNTAGGFIVTPAPTAAVGKPVTLTGGTGAGATAVANMDANGNIVSITITNPGVNFNNGTTTPPTIILNGQPTVLPQTGRQPAMNPPVNQPAPPAPDKGLP